MYIYIYSYIVFFAWKHVDIHNYTRLAHSQMYAYACVCLTSCCQHFCLCLANYSPTVPLKKPLLYTHLAPSPIIKTSCISQALPPTGKALRSRRFRLILKVSVHVGRLVLRPWPCCLGYSHHQCARSLHLGWPPPRNGIPRNGPLNSGCHLVFFGQASIVSLVAG